MINRSAAIAAGGKPTKPAFIATVLPPQSTAISSASAPARTPMESLRIADSLISASAHIQSTRTDLM